MRIFPDTNVLVSAFLSEGVCYRLIGRIVASPEHELLIGAFVLEETKRKLREKIRAPEEEILVFERALLTVGEDHPMPSAPTPISIRDLDDTWVLASALAAEADVLVTGDRELLDLAGRIEGLAILGPRPLLDRLGAGESQPREP